VEVEACWTARGLLCKPRSVMRSLFGLLLLGGLAWCAGLAWFMGVPVPLPPPGTHTDAIVMLTGDEGRVPHGLALLQDGAAPRALISGVAAGVGPRALAREAHVPFALFRCCVDLGHAAIDTRSNAEETAAWVADKGVRSIRLVTSDYHMRRATLELAAELPPGTRIVADPVPSRVEPRLWVREYMKWLVRGFARRAQAQT